MVICIALCIASVALVIVFAVPNPLIAFICYLCIVQSTVASVAIIVLMSPTFDVSLIIILIVVYEA